jgi:hypothetical protein
MSAIAISSIVFGCVSGGALLGMYLRTVLPQEHLSPDSKDVVKMGMGLVATMSALVLSLVISSAKGSFDALSSEMTKVSSEIILLDRTWRSMVRRRRRRANCCAVPLRLCLIGWSRRKLQIPRICGHLPARWTLCTKRFRDSCRRTTGNVPPRPGLWAF